MKKIILIVIICLFGFSSRLFVFQSQHPDTDELFELRHMQQLKFTDTIKRTTFYGDHTSYPGEFLLHWIPMRILNLFEKPADLSYEDKTIAGIDKRGFWILATPKIILSMLSFYLFWLLCQNFVLGVFGTVIAFMVYAFNSNLIYHSFSLRPYGVLPELAVINLFLASRDKCTLKFVVTHGAVIFLTCVYHAYGILIAFLPILFFQKKRTQNFIWFIIPALIFWIYYASYSTFGLTPNKVQSVVDTFQFITKENFLNGILDSLFSGSLLTIAILPFVLWGVCKSPERTTILFIGILVVLPLASIILVDIKTHYWIHPRQYSWIIPALGLWCGMMADRFRN